LSSEAGTRHRCGRRAPPRGHPLRASLVVYKETMSKEETTKQLERGMDPTRKGEHLDDPMMVTLDAKAMREQEAELKALLAGAAKAAPEAKGDGAAPLAPVKEE